MPKLALTSLVALLACGVAAPIISAQDEQQASSRTRLERAFVSGGRVYLDLSAGAYRIEGTPDRTIRVRWHTREAQDLDRVRARVDVKGSDASVYLSGPSNNFEVDIEMPQRSDVTLRLSAGDLKIRRIEGSKDIDLWAGDVTIEVGDPARYRRVDASVRAGQITAEPFKANKGGLFRSLEHAGKGPYDLRVRLFAGDLKLVP